MPIEVYRDAGLCSGLHCGATSSTKLCSTKYDFELLEAVDRLISNDSDGSTGTVRSVVPPTNSDKRSYLTATLSGGSANQWTLGATFTLYITDTANKKISSTVICKQSGFAYPRKILVDGEHPDEIDEPDKTGIPTTRRK